ncbi:hypothetical protein ACN47E_007168 [Coniothyrium glycines]
MLPDLLLLTSSTSDAHHKRGDLSTATSPAASKARRPRLYTNPATAILMAHDRQRSNQSPNERELWFSMSASFDTAQHDYSQRVEQSAYRATSSRMSGGPSITRTPPKGSVVSGTSDVNKPLPPSPSEAERRHCAQTSFRSLLPREPPGQLDATRLQPEPYPDRTSSLSLDTHSQYHHSYSRSMPSSPYAYEQTSALPAPTTLPRAHSSMGDYADPVGYQPSSVSLPQHLTAPYLQQRSTSMNTYFEPPTPPRSRTFPESPVSPTARESLSGRPRPHTWLSPTEPFSDASQFQMFAEAMTGLPDDSDPFSPTGPPQLQGSLFARRNKNDTIPLPLRYPAALSADSTRPHVRDDWQNFEPPPSISLRPTTSSSLPRPGSRQQWQPPAYMAGINRELELLGLDDEHRSDDELPNYAQSQAEMNDRKRLQASARARELEARWRGTQR